MEDQRTFASLSGDRNPMHMDFDVARRTQGAGVSVHGVHIVLWTLDQLCAQGVDIARFGSFAGSYLKFVLVDEPVESSFWMKNESVMKAEATVFGQPVVEMTFKTIGEEASGGSAFLGFDEYVIADQPSLLSLAEMRDFAAWLSPPASEDALIHAFPSLCKALGVARVSAFALLSGLVGMACPGLHSMSSGFSLRLAQERPARAGLGARTSFVDARSRMIRLEVAGSGVVGEVFAFERFPPIETRLEDVEAAVAPGEFAEMRALVIGGSRGLGAATAKLIVAGGGQALLTYRHGAREAEALCAELSARFGSQKCRAISYDVRGDAGTQLADAARDVTHLFYFATPRIFGRHGVLFNQEAFEEFCEYYVVGFYRLVELLTSTRPRERLQVLYPSSIDVEKRPSQMIEYIMAKTAGEIICQELARALPDLQIVVPRLPRVLTDQTACAPPVPAADSVATMLPLLRATKGLGTGT
jgi:hypothetical protein